MSRDKHPRRDGRPRDLGYQLVRTRGRHLTWLAVGLLVTIVAGIAAPVVVVVVAIQHDVLPLMVGGTIVVAVTGSSLMLVTPRILHAIAAIVREQNSNPLLPLVAGDRHPERVTGVH